MYLNKRKLVSILVFLITTLPALPATFTVTSNADSGPGTLRDAITQVAANGSATPDIIIFNLADQSMTGRTIDLLTELPVLSSNLVIDGTTQPGSPFYVTDAHIFVRMMHYTGPFSMLKVYNCNSVQIYGLYLYYGDYAGAIFSTNGSHQLYGIDISNSSNVVIGAPGKGNVLNGEATGIWSADNTPLTHDITIRSNYIGCGSTNDPAVPDVDNGISTMDVGMNVKNVQNLTIGGAISTFGNVISGQAGLWIGSNAPTGNGTLLIQNNHFARYFDKTTLLRGFDGFNQYIIIGVTGNTFQDYSLQFWDNDIPERVSIGQLSASFSIKRNVFGICPDFLTADTKLQIDQCSAGGVIGGDDPADANQFLLGQHDGFAMHTGGNGPITSIKNIYECNSQYGSTTLTDSTAFGNNVPFVQIIQPTPTAVSGFGTPNCRIDLYYDDECTACEGKIYIGKTQSDATGNWTYSGPVNGTVVATATNSQGRTGDFSAPRIFYDHVKIIQPSCGLANGSITELGSDGAETFYWVNLTTGATVGHSLDLINAGPGEYAVYGVHGGTCIRPIYASIQLGDVTPHLLTANAVVTQPGCGQFNGSITGIGVSENVNLQFTWVNDLDQTVSTAQDLTNAGPGQYKLIVKDAVTGCSDQTTIYPLVNQAGPSIDITQAEIIGTRCQQPTGEISNILVTNITGPASYTWIDASGKTVGNSATLQNVPGGNYRLVFKDQGACPAITTPVFVISNTGGEVRLTADKTATADESCERRNGSITVQSFTPTPTGFSFSWIDEATGLDIGSGTSIANLPAGSYDLQATDAAGCPQTVKTFPISDDPAPKIDISGIVVTQDICSQHIGAITGIVVQGTPSFTFAWYDVSGAPLAMTKDLASVGTGSYHLVVNDANECSTTGPVIAVTNTTQQLNTPSYGDIIVLSGQTATLTVKNHDAGTYDLYASDPVNGGANATPEQSNSSGNFATPPLDADTTLYVVLKKGDCSSAAVPVYIKVLLTKELIIPNAFTPNGDGHNDLFRIKNPQLVQTLSMMIFDRWGTMVFESSDPYRGWDGTRNGHPASAGTYVWAIYYTDILGRNQNLRGAVILVR